VLGLQKLQLEDKIYERLKGLKPKTSEARRGSGQHGIDSEGSQDQGHEAFRYLMSSVDLVSERDDKLHHKKPAARSKHRAGDDTPDSSDDEDDGDQDHDDADEHESTKDSQPVTKEQDNKPHTTVSDRDVSESKAASGRQGASKPKSSSGAGSYRLKLRRNSPFSLQLAYVTMQKASPFYDHVDAQVLLASKELLVNINQETLPQMATFILRDFFPPPTPGASLQPDKEQVRETARKAREAAKQLQRLKGGKPEGRDKKLNVEHDEQKKRNAAELLCGVCSELIMKPFQAPCGHKFCKDCVDQLMTPDRHTVTVSATDALKGEAQKTTDQRAVPSLAASACCPFASCQECFARDDLVPISQALQINVEVRALKLRLSSLVCTRAVVICE